MHTFLWHHLNPILIFILIPFPLILATFYGNIRPILILRIRFRHRNFLAYLSNPLKVFASVSRLVNDTLLMLHQLLHSFVLHIFQLVQLLLFILQLCRPRPLQSVSSPLRLLKLFHRRVLALKPILIFSLLKSLTQVVSVQRVGFMARRIFFCEQLVVREIVVEELIRRDGAVRFRWVQEFTCFCVLLFHNVIIVVWVRLRVEVGGILLVGLRVC